MSKSLIIPFTIPREMIGLLSGEEQILAIAVISEVSLYKKTAF